VSGGSAEGFEVAAAVVTGAGATREGVESSSWAQAASKIKSDSRTRTGIRRMVLPFLVAGGEPLLTASFQYGALRSLKRFTAV
jgi:hypothetical protein